MTLSIEALLAYSHAFEALASGRFDNFKLWPCQVNGEDSLEVVALHSGDDDGTIVVQPLFVAITEGMVIVHDKRRHHSGGDDGGPNRDSVSDEFAAAKGAASPHPGG